MPQPFINSTTPCSTTALIHAAAIIDPSALIEKGVTIGPYCVIGADVRIGEGTTLHSHVVIEPHTTLGEHCRVHSYAVLGDAPQSVHYKGEPTKTRIGDHTTIREHVTINRGTVQGRGETVVGKHCYLMTACHIAHDSIVGDYVQFANNATIGGHVVVGDYAILGGLCAVHQFVRIGHHAMISGMAGVKHNVIPYGMVSEDDTKLSGLNLVGLKRRGFSSDEIQTLRKAYTLLFEGKDKPFSERLMEIKQDFGDSPVVSGMISFIESNADRPLCQVR